MSARVKVWMKVAGGFAILIVLIIAVTMIAYVQNRSVAKAVASAEALMGNSAPQDMMVRIIEILQARMNEGQYGLQGGNLKDVADQVKSLNTMVADLLKGGDLNASQRERLQKMAQSAETFRSDYMAYWVERGNEARYASDWSDARDRLDAAAGHSGNLAEAFDQLQVTALTFLKDKQPLAWDAYTAAQADFTSTASRAKKGDAALMAAADEYAKTMASYKTYFEKESAASVTMTKTVNDILSTSRDLERELTQIQQNSSATAILLMFIALALAVLVGVGIALIITRGITVPVTRAVQFARTIAQGDLTQRLAIEQKDEIGELASSLDQMAGKLGEMVTTIQDSAEQVAASSEQISASSVNLTEGAQGQASTLEETSASVEELAASIDQVSSHAASQAAAFEQGAGSMAQVQKSIEDISLNLGKIADMARMSLDRSQEGAQAVDQVVEAITLIAQGSERIAGIVSMITDIANQTNLLALNASIEAARAGEYGRGFAVVADEVSKLAARSATSAKEIETLIQESVKNVTVGVDRAKGSKVSMEQIMETARFMSDMIHNVSTAMQQQVSGVRELSKALENISEMAQSISAASEEQSASAKEVSRAVEKGNDLTQQTASSTEQISASAEQLSGMASQLQSLISTFKVARNGSGKIEATSKAPEAAALPKAEPAPLEPVSGPVVPSHP